MKQQYMMMIRDTFVRDAQGCFDPAGEQWVDLFGPVQLSACEAESQKEARKIFCRQYPNICPEVFDVVPGQVSIEELAIGLGRKTAEKMETGLNDCAECLLCDSCRDGKECTQQWSAFFLGILESLTGEERGDFDE